MLNHFFSPEDIAKLSQISSEVHGVVIPRDVKLQFNPICCGLEVEFKILPKELIKLKPNGMRNVIYSVTG